MLLLVTMVKKEVSDVLEMHKRASQLDQYLNLQKRLRTTVVRQPRNKKPNILTAGSIYYNGEYSEGTSYSTPIVTGVLAAVKSRKPLSSSQMKDLLYSTADDIDQPFHHQGFGLMNLDRIMEVISDGENNSQIEGQGES